jgi:two-component system sensor histidine kinase HupT/HoxJ
VNLKPGAYCRLRIKDNGPGIAPENLGRLFDPFFTTKPQGEGTGLGLSVVSGLVKSWGGDISAANDPAGGAVFTIYVPTIARQLQAAQ